MKEIENQPADAHCENDVGLLERSRRPCSALISFRSTRTLSIASLILRRLSWAVVELSNVSESESNFTKPFRSFSRSCFVLTILPDRSMREKKLPTMCRPFLDNDGGCPGSVELCLSSSDNECSETFFLDLKPEERSPEGYY